MAKNSKVTEEDLLTRLRNESGAAIGAHTGDLAEEIEQLNDYYHGRPYGNEVKGRSKFVTREVYETIESLMPYLVKIFFSSDQAVIFTPEDEDDVLSTKQETEYVNWVFYKDNPGYKIGYTWLKDGLMNKNGYVKIAREAPEPVTTRFENQTEEQVALLLQNAPEDFEGDATILQQDDGLFTVDVIEIKGRDRTVIYNLPPEEFRISEGDLSPQTARYCSHDAMRSISSIRAMGLDIDDDINDDSGDTLATDTLRIDRSIEREFEDNKSDFDLGPSREVLLREEYLRIDRNGDGMDELWKFLRVGDEILHEEMVEQVDIYSWTPIIVPHRHHGSTPADPVMDIQLLKSKVTRNLLDNQEQINTGRYAVVDGQVNLDDLMNPRGIVRENFAGAVRGLPTVPLDRSAFDVLGIADAWAEKRTGVSERGQGLDPKMFNSNTAASTAELAMSSAEQKSELIARTFAETGLKELMLGIHRLGLKHEHPGKKIRNNNGEFIAIDPNMWRTRYDMDVTVGIGNGSKNQQMLQMQMIEQTIQSIVGAGGLGTLITPTNIWEFAMEKTRVTGRKDGGKFFTKPQTDQTDEGPTVEEQVKMGELELKKAEQAGEQEKIEIQKAELMLAERKLALEERMADLKQRIHEDENEFKMAELQLEFQQQRAVKIGDKE